jgi:RimJ/RimL family protein N-acetyltransferase
MALPSHITVRALEMDDFASFLVIQQDAILNAPEVFGSDYDWFDALSLLSKEQRYQEYMDFPYQYLLGAVDEDDHILGMIGFSCPHYRRKLRHKGKIWGMYVIPEERGQGIATALVETAIHTAREIDCELIQISVGTKNRESYSLYLRLGFSVYGTEAKAMKIDDEYVDEYLMVKFLK